MSDKSQHIELKNYKVLLLQMATRLLSKVTDTGLKPESKRQLLARQLEHISKDLEREFKRDTTLANSAEAKADLYADLYKGGIPDWLLSVLFESIVEESHKLNRRNK